MVRSNSTSRPRFQYAGRTRENVRDRASQSNSNFDSIIKDKFDTFTPKVGSYAVRFLPPTWEGYNHYGFDIFVHYGIGSDDQSYLCPNRMLKEPCPICEERKRLLDAGEEELARKLNATKRVAVWMINRDAEDEGPLIWTMPWTVDRDIATMSTDKRSGEILLVEDPDEGFDIEFERQGQGIQTKYIGLQISRRSSPLHDDPEVSDAWIDYVLENPLPECLNIYDYDYISEVFKGTSRPREDSKSPEVEREAPRRALRTDRQERPRGDEVDTSASSDDVGDQEDNNEQPWDDDNEDSVQEDDNREERVSESRRPPKSDARSKLASLRQRRV